MRQRAIIVIIINNPVAVPPCSVVADDLYIPFLLQVLGVKSVKKYTSKLNERHYAKYNSKYETGFNVVLTLDSGYIDITRSKNVA